MATQKFDFSKFKFVTPIGIASFANVFKPHAFEGQEPAYSIVIAYSPEQAAADEFKALKQLCQKAAIERFGEETLRKLLKAKKFRWPWRDGVEYEEKYGEPFVEGGMFISLKSKKTQPGVIDRSRNAILDPMDFYNGCKVRASGVCGPYDNMGNTGIMLMLNNVQKTGDGPKLGNAGGGDAKNDFEDDLPVEKGAKAKPKAAAASTAGSFDDDEEDDMFA